MMPYIVKESEFLIQTFLIEQDPNLDDFHSEFYQTIFFLKTKEGGTLITYFRKIKKLLIPTFGKDITKTENYKPISLMSMNVKIFNKDSVRS